MILIAALSRRRCGRLPRLSLRKFDPPVRRRLEAAIELLATEPRPPAATRLVGGGGEWRVRTGDYRIVYEIEEDRLLVPVA
jgi:mRNA interferase RelE/StbE